VQSANGTPTHIIQQPISGSPRPQQQIIMQHPGTSNQQVDGVPQQIQYITSSGTAGSTRIRMGGSQSTSQQVTYVTATSQHQRA
jgi:hypothetical protein